MDAQRDRQVINNAYYDRLAERWYTAHDDPIAILQAETRETLRWAGPILRENSLNRILDVGCGAGFASNVLASRGFQMTGIDFSQDALRIAQAHDITGSVKYVQGDAYKLPFESQWFDAVLAFDFLEHVTNPLKVLTEIARVLKPGGFFLFHTFNRNPLSWLVVLKGIEWFVKNTPPDLHVYRLFITPKEMENHCLRAGMFIQEWQGLRPRINGALLKMIYSREVPDDFEFTTTKSLRLSYCGVARKRLQ